MEQSGIKNPKVGTRKEQSGNKVGTRTQKWEQERNKVGTKWDQEPKSGNKRGTKWEHSGVKNPKVGTREEQSGNKVGSRTQKWEQERNKVFLFFGFSLFVPPPSIVCGLPCPDAHHLFFHRSFIVAHEVSHPQLQSKPLFRGFFSLKKLFVNLFSTLCLHDLLDQPGTHLLHQNIPQAIILQLAIFFLELAHCHEE